MRAAVRSSAISNDRSYANIHAHSTGYRFIALAEQVSTGSLRVYSARSQSFFRRVGAVATSLVKALCRNEPCERLGSGTGGFDDIRKHRFAEPQEFSALSLPSVQLVHGIRLARAAETCDTTTDSANYHFAYGYLEFRSAAALR